MDPNNLNLRSEYKALCDVKSAKEKEWYSKMNGFYNGEKLKKIEDADEEETLLREKVKRQTF